LTQETNGEDVRPVVVVLIVEQVVVVGPGQCVVKAASPDFPIRRWSVPNVIEDDFISFTTLT